MPAQPSDEWTYLRPEEFADDDAVERIGASLDIGAEDAALHPLDLDELQTTPTALDPGETLPRPPAPNGRTTTYFDDEEPDDGDEAGPRVDDEPSEEPSVDQILVSQHYAFDQDAQLNE